MSKTTEPKLDVVGVGNAIVDILSYCNEDVLTKNKLHKGTMTLVDEAQSTRLYLQVQESKECSGGSVANTLVGLASLGARCGFIGKVADDTLGALFTADLQAIGVQYNTPCTFEEISTANCLVFVTPDAQRTMATYIGACSLVSEKDIDEELIASASILYIEGYLWDTEHAKAAIRKAIKTAKKAGRKVAFTLSDTFCVDRHRDEFLQLAELDIDILFANENEISALYETDNLEAALKKVRGMCEVALITRGEKGCIVLTEDAQLEVPAATVAKVVDTTGAGDLFASGFLFGYIKGKPLEECANLGNRCAGKIIGQLGARSVTPLNELLA